MFSSLHQTDTSQTQHADLNLLSSHSAAFVTSTPLLSLTLTRSTSSDLVSFSSTGIWQVVLTHARNRSGRTEERMKRRTHTPIRSGCTKTRLRGKRQDEARTSARRIDSCDSEMLRIQDWHRSGLQCPTSTCFCCEDVGREFLSDVAAVTSRNRYGNSLRRQDRPATASKTCQKLPQPSHLNNCSLKLTCTFLSLALEFYPHYRQDRGPCLGRHCQDRPLQRAGTLQP